MGWGRVSTGRGQDASLPMRFAEALAIDVAGEPARSRARPMSSVRNTIQSNLAIQHALAARASALDAQLSALDHLIVCRFSSGCIC